jgi:RNA polymerase sigma factor (sigma-70 family)
VTIIKETTPNRLKDISQWWIEAEKSLFLAAQNYVDSSTAQELVQDIAVLALENCPNSVRTAQQFKRWAYARLYWFALDELRLQKRRPQEQLEAVTAAQSIPPSQEQELVIQDIWKSIAKLPRRQQAVLTGMMQGRSNEVLAKQLQISEATVRSLQRFARKRLILLLHEVQGE